MADEIEESVEDQQAEAAFEAGYKDPSTPVTDTPPEDKIVKTAEEIAAEAAAAEAIAAVAAEEKKDPPDPDAPPANVKPEYVQITKEQLANLETAAAKTATFETQLNKAFGSIGGLTQLVNDLKSKTPEGAVITIPDDAFADMEDFPDIAKGMRSALEKVLKGQRGTGDVKATVDLDVVNKSVRAGIQAREIEALEDDHPDWKTIVGAVDSADKADPNNAFRKWLGTQPADYQKKVNETHSAPVLARAIDKFKEATKVVVPPPKVPAPKDLARKNKIAAAIQPRGDGHVPLPAKTDEDAFEEGFNKRFQSG